MLGPALSCVFIRSIAFYHFCSRYWRFLTNNDGELRRTYPLQTVRLPNRAVSFLSAVHFVFSRTAVEFTPACTLRSDYVCVLCPPTYHGITLSMRPLVTTSRAIGCWLWLLSRGCSSACVPSQLESPPRRSKCVFKRY